MDWFFIPHLTGIAGKRVKRKRPLGLMIYLNMIFLDILSANSIILLHVFIFV